MNNNQKLNLNWVTDTIGNDYKNWKSGDIVTIEAQTGTGKTHFIKTILTKELNISEIPIENEYMLFICNRTNLKRQLKIDLLKQANKEVPEDLDELDKITKIGNIVICSYHAIQNNELDIQYNIKERKDYNYKYIVCDESHFLFADASFNNKNRLTYQTLIEEHNRDSIKIFISATITDTKAIIKKRVEQFWGNKPNLHEYSTGVDYSYLKVNYFNKTKTIVTAISNDKSNEKWLIFVSNLNDAKYIKEELEKQSEYKNKDNLFHKVEIIKSGTKSDELNNIINNSKFDCKIMICTKAMDNGINFNDDKLINIVIMSWNKTDFIQMLGRKRIDINNAQTVNLYIIKRYKKSFTSKSFSIENILDVIKLHREDYNLFCRKYDNDLKTIGEYGNVFYKNRNGEWKVNKIAHARLLKDLAYYTTMIDAFSNEGEDAFIKEQLDWLELEDSYNPNNDIDDLVNDNDMSNLQKYLENNIGKVMLMKNDRKELIEKIGLIDKHNSNFKKDNIKYIQNIDTLNSYIKKDLELDYEIKEFETSRTIDGNKKKYKSAWKIMKLIDNNENADEK